MIAIIQKCNNAKELIHELSRQEVQQQGKMDRFLEDHKQVIQKRKRIGLQEKANQRKEDQSMRDDWSDLWGGYSFGVDMGEA